MQVPPFLQVQLLLQLAPQRPSGQGRWQRAPVGEKGMVSLAGPPLTSTGALMDILPAGSIPQLWGTWGQDTSVLTRPAGLALAVSMNRVAAIRVVTVTAAGTAFAKLPLLGEGVEGGAGQSAQSLL